MVQLTLRPCVVGITHTLPSDAASVTQTSDAADLSDLCLEVQQVAVVVLFPVAGVLDQLEVALRREARHGRFHHVVVVTELRRAGKGRHCLKRVIAVTSYCGAVTSLCYFSCHVEGGEGCEVLGGGGGV